VKKTAEGFGCSRVTFVGDRGMIKSPQISELNQAGFHYITAITKAQIRKLIGEDVLQMSLFDEAVCEVIHDEVRYILRRNPIRADEMADERASKQAAVQELIDKQNEYLSNHPRAKVFTAWEKVQEKMDRLKVSGWLKLKIDDRKMSLSIDEEALAEATRLDGCYVLKTDLPPEVVDKETIHERYKDLADVEQAFRTCKTAHLKVRPVYVRKADNTRGHVLVVMLAYLVIRVLKDAWKAVNVTVEEGLDILRTICAVEMRTESGGACLRVPSPGNQAVKLLESLGLQLPTLLPKMNIRVDTHRKLPDRRN
jgi:hypothetical protein